MEPTYRKEKFSYTTVLFIKCWQSVHLDDAQTHCLNVCYVFAVVCLHAFLGSLGVISAWKDLNMFVFCGSKGKRSKHLNLTTSCRQKDADVRQRESEYLGLLIFLFCFPLLSAFVSPCLCAGPTGVGLDELKRKLLISDPQHFSVTIPRKFGSLLVWSKHASAKPHLWPSLFSSHVHVAVYLSTIL